MTTYTFSASANLGGIIVLLLVVILFIAGIRWAFSYDFSNLKQDTTASSEKVTEQPENK